MTGGGGRVVLRRLAVAAAVVLAVTATAFAPRALRSVDAFHVRTVEVEGVRFLDPYAVVRASGIGPTSNLFDGPDRWRYGVLTLPLVDDVTIRRRVPSSVTITVREVEPLALVPSGSLRPVDVSGRTLEIEPAGALMDLPVLSGAKVRAGRVDPDAVAALETLSALRAEAPELTDRISQLELSGDGVRVLFRDDAAEALLPVRPTPVQRTQLRIAFADLHARGEVARVRRIDVRFRDQVVVSFLSSPDPR